MVGVNPVAFLNDDSKTLHLKDLEKIWSLSCNLQTIWWNENQTIDQKNRNWKRGFFDFKNGIFNNCNFPGWKENLISKIIV